jgi:hypothetical protein
MCARLLSDDTRERSTRDTNRTRGVAVRLAHVRCPSPETHGAGVTGARGGEGRHTCLAASRKQ